MVNVLTDIRNGVAADLNDSGVPALVYVPAHLNTPLALVGSGATYVDAPVGQNPFGKSFSVNVSVLLLAADSAINEYTLEVIDDLIVNAIDALGDWDITDVSAPFTWVNEDNTSYTAALLNITTNTDIERMV